MLNPSDIRYLVIHCSDTSDEDMLRAADIHHMHLGFGWDGAGYHQIICRDGTIQAGRPEYWQGAHVKGRNQDSLGVCLIGRKNFTPAQFAALEKLLFEWRSQYPDAQIVGHRDIQETHKTCPNFDVASWWQTRNPAHAGQAVILSAYAPLYKSPPEQLASEKRTAETEALYGQSVTLAQHAPVSGFMKVALQADGYIGWIDSRHVTVFSQPLPASVQICAPQVLVTQAADVKSTPLMTLSMGAQVHVLEQGDEYSAIALIGRANSYQTGYIATSALTRPSDWVEAGLSCLHIPYKWGGRSYDGMDCSGLVQLAFAACGYDIPRDSGPQQAFMAYAAKTQDTGFGQFQRGDILFWDGHVAICIDGDDMLHANGFHHCVKIEPINTAIQRIARHSGQPTAHIDGQLLLSGLR